MNRHHPYSGSFENIGPRRGGHPVGPGPDRSHRFQERGCPPRGRGGPARGRGSHGGFSGSMSQSYDPYDQGDVGPYDAFETQSQQTPYYQNGYGVPCFASGLSPYNQDYVKYEDGPGANFNESGYGRRPPRKERDDKVHDSIIEERIQRERPCRTLFIRNIKYETDSSVVRRQFEEHGEIKTFFDLISTRGMVFVTYYDLRAAERARERLQGSEISGRPIDVHYSLPRDDHTRGIDRDKNQQLQGTLQVSLRDSVSGHPLDDNEVRRKFQQFGDVKSIKPVGDRPDSRYVEFYDIRACEEAFDRLRHQGLQDGVMDIVLAWEPAETQVPHSRDPGSNRDWDDIPRGGRPGRGRGRGGRGRGHHDDDRRGGSDRYERGGSRGGRGRLDDDYGHGRRGGRGGGMPDRFSRDVGPYGDTGGSGGNYGPSLTSSGYGMLPPPPPQTTIPNAPTDDRLEAARKVQQLLAALKQPSTSPATHLAAPTGTEILSPGQTSVIQPTQPSAPNLHPYYTQPPAAQYSQTPVLPYVNNPQHTTPQAPVASAAGTSGVIPPDLLSLIQATQQRPSASQYAISPQLLNGQTSPAHSSTGANPQFQQLMSYLNSAGGKS